MIASATSRLQLDFHFSVCCSELPEKTPTLGINEDHGANVKGTPESDISFLDPSGLYVHKTLPAVGKNLSLDLFMT